jgi:uncharacterized protein YggE
MMRRWMLHVCLVMALNSMVHVTAQDSTPTISVVGEASVKLPADEIVIFASIESRAKTAAEACKDNREKSRKLIEFLRAKSIEEQHVVANLVSIDAIMPEERSSKGGKGYQSETNENPFGNSANAIEIDASLGRRPRAIGFVARRSFAIVVKDLAAFEDIYQGIVDLGVNQVDNVEYRSTKSSGAREKLRLEAVRDATKKAKHMAEELGATLASIKTISNDTLRTASSRSRGPPGYPGWGGDPFGDGEPSSFDQQIRLECSVNIVFCLGNTDLKK